MKMYVKMLIKKVPKNITGLIGERHLMNSNPSIYLKREGKKGCFGDTQKPQNHTCDCVGIEMLL